MASAMQDPATRAVAVTPNDNTDLGKGIRALWIGGAGDVAVTMINASAAVTLAGATAGTIIPIRVEKVMSTNTSATNIVALY